MKNLFMETYKKLSNVSAETIFAQSSHDGLEAVKVDIESFG